MNTSTFSSRLQDGLLGEGKISKWLIGRGFNVLPAYEIEQSSGKGPRLFTGNGNLICPDLLCFKVGKVVWIEAKSKSAFTWYRKTKTWQTGIDRKHWNHYQEVAKQSPWDVWLLFLHRPGALAKDTPDGMESPTGLYGNSIQKLIHCIDHEHENWGPSGMVYWSIENLLLLADYNSVEYTTDTCSAV